MLEAKIRILLVNDDLSPSKIMKEFCPTQNLGRYLGRQGKTMALDGKTSFVTVA